MRLMRCVPCVAFILALVCAAFAAKASPGPLSTISGDGLLSLVGAILFALLAGYAKGQERRITVLEREARQQQSQINLLSERVLREHPSRKEFSGLRAEMQGRFDRLENLILERRQP